MGVRKDIPNVKVINLYHDIIKTHWNPDTPKDERNGKIHFVNVKQAIGDLPSVEPGGDASTDNFYYPCNNNFLKRIIIRKTKRFAIPERAVYFLKTKRTAGGTPPPQNIFDRLTPVFT